MCSQWLVSGRCKEWTFEGRHAVGKMTEALAEEPETVVNFHVVRES